jgi:hypothetical protein
LIGKLLLAAALAAPAVASADDVASRLGNYEAEARTLGTDMPTAQSLGAPSTSSHRLVDAQVAFGLGDYDAAINQLFDLANHPGPDAEAATYYLAESLYQKGDRGAAHNYFAQLATSGSANGKYYQPALGRLIELSIVTGDDSEVGTWTGKLDQIAPGLRQPLVPYVRGKLAYSQGKLDEAIAYFQDVPKGSDWDMQTEFFTGTIAVAKQDLAKATDIFTDLIARKPRTSADRRVIELGELALGRLYYERDQFGKSIDAYLLVDRHSDLFPDALYEVSWVYVKNKQYDKALRALELLGQSEPDSGRTPTIRILEGNLRIRKAQMIRASQVEGTGNAADDPGIEYEKANTVFTDTHDQYYPGYIALSKLVVANADPAKYFDQLTGRGGRAFEVTAPLPDEAATFIRDQPGMQRLVGIANDLAVVRTTLDQTRQMLDELDLVIASKDTYDVYPSLSAKRARIAAIEDDLVKVRDDLADQQLSLVNPSGDLAQLTATRKQLSQQYGSQPNVEAAHGKAIGDAQSGYDAIESAADEVDSALDSTHAMAVAMRTYASFTSDQQQQVSTGLDDAAKDSHSIEGELRDVREELAIGRTLARFGDDGSAQTRALRKQVTQAQDAEHRVLAGFASASRDPKRSQDLAALGDRAARIADQLDQLDAQMDAVAQQALQNTKQSIATERTNLAGLDKELADAEGEARDGGTAVLAQSFLNARVKLYDIVVRTDVGNVDVAWSQKEDNDDDLKRLNLARARELKQLRDEFKDILDDTTPKPPEHHKSDLPPPDANTGDGRVNAGTSPQGTGPASVKPDEQKDQKKGGSK